MASSCAKTTTSWASRLAHSDCSRFSPCATAHFNAPAAPNRRWGVGGGRSVQVAGEPARGFAVAGRRYVGRGDAHAESVADDRAVAGAADGVVNGDRLELVAAGLVSSQR